MIGWSRMPSARAPGVSETEGLVAVPDQMAWRLFPRKGVGYLPRNPLGGGIGGNGD
jgi:hypothetical protein